METYELVDKEIASRLTKGAIVLGLAQHIKVGSQCLYKSIKKHTGQILKKKNRVLVVTYFNV